MLRSALAQEIGREVAKGRLRQCDERQWSRDLYRSESKPSSQQSVEHALAQSGGELCNNAMTDHLLHHAIADREPASDRQVCHAKPR